MEREQAASSHTCLYELDEGIKWGVPTSRRVRQKESFSPTTASVLIAHATPCVMHRGQQYTITQNKRNPLIYP
jgi:hypothetical protein